MAEPSLDSLASSSSALFGTHPSASSAHHSEHLNCASNNTTMLRRHHMRCRCGSSRGRASRPPLSHHSDSSSPLLDHSYGRYPATRSGRGQDLNLRRSRSPLLPHLEASPSLQHAHTAQFHYNFSLNRPSITATISISFKEEAICTESPHPKKLPKNSISFSTPTSNKGKSFVPSATQGAHATNSQSTSSESSDSSSEDWVGDDGISGNERTANLNEPAAMDTRDATADDIEEYKCLIVEEMPPSGNDT